jgi:hypothetical protein
MLHLAGLRNVVEKFFGKPKQKKRGTLEQHKHVEDQSTEN